MRRPVRDFLSRQSKFVSRTRTERTERSPRNSFTPISVLLFYLIKLSSHRGVFTVRDPSQKSFLPSPGSLLYFRPDRRLLGRVRRRRKDGILDVSTGSVMDTKLDKNITFHSYEKCKNLPIFVFLFLTCR